MNSRKVAGMLAAILGVLTILTAIYTVLTRGNAGASVVLMVSTLEILAYYRNRNKGTM